MFGSKQRRGMCTGIVTFAATITLAACGGSSDASGDKDPMTVELGYFPLVHTATVVHAQETGLFEDEGLNVELMQTSGGAQALPSLMAGEYDITFLNYTSAILGAHQGMSLRIIAGNDIGTSDHGIMVNEDSPLKEPADLEGKTIAVNNLQNIGTVAANAVLDGAGVDLSSVDYVELPLPDMQAALDRGDVDAIWQVEPFLASSQAAGDRILFELFSGPADDMPVAGWLTTQQFAEENPEAVAAFQRALEASVEDLQGNRERLVELVPTYTDVPADVVEEVEMPAWEAAPDTDQLQKISDLMTQYDLIDDEFDVEPIVVEAS